MPNPDGSITRAEVERMLRGEVPARADPPTCECGELAHASRDGQSWECHNPDCSGFMEFMCFRVE